MENKKHGILGGLIMKLRGRIGEDKGAGRGLPLRGQTFLHIKSLINQSLTPLPKKNFHLAIAFFTFYPYIMILLPGKNPWILQRFYRNEACLQSPFIHNNGDFL
ncbi:MAG: hypothetical protein LBC70_10665 [Chitinispirillales bacterium]|jgi:hypothetical protein|nr:hypothetical protein [Chitinispirillales bacterium]